MKKNYHSTIGFQLQGSWGGGGGWTSSRIKVYRRPLAFRSIVESCHVLTHILKHGYVTVYDYYERSHRFGVQQILTSCSGLRTISTLNKKPSRMRKLMREWGILHLAYSKSSNPAVCVCVCFILCPVHTQVFMKTKKKKKKQQLSVSFGKSRSDFCHRKFEFFLQYSQCLYEVQHGSLSPVRCSITFRRRADGQMHNIRIRERLNGWWKGQQRRLNYLATYHLATRHTHIHW